MSAEHPPYHPLIITAWTWFSILTGVVLLGMFFFGDRLLLMGHIAWDLVRWLASPII